MAGDWIKFDVTTPDKPEVVRMATALGIDQDAVVGKLLRVWAWADQNAVVCNGECNGLTVTSAFLDRLTFCPGFARAMQNVGWLVGQDESFSFPNFSRHNGKTAKERAVSNRRVSAHRTTSEKSNGASVTDVTVTPLQKPLPEKRERREEKEQKQEQSSLRSDLSSPDGEDLLGGQPANDRPADRKPTKTERIRQIAEDAQAAYNAILAKPKGRLAACSLLNGPRLKAVEKALPTMRAMCRNLYGDERITPEFFAAYFGEVSHDDWHSGRTCGGPGHENWKPDFEYLLREGVMAKLFDRAMSEAA